MCFRNNHDFYTRSPGACPRIAKGRGGGGAGGENGVRNFRQDTTVYRQHILWNSFKGYRHCLFLYHYYVNSTVIGFINLTEICAFGHLFFIIRNMEFTFRHHKRLFVNACTIVKWKTTGWGKFNKRGRGGGG